MTKKSKVLVAMSGGVDSSVVAALLIEQGYEVDGVFMVNYNTDLTNYSERIKQIDQKKSCWRGDYQDALRVAAKLGIKLLRLDFTKEYSKRVLDYMYREYRAGRTPNPDVLCNKYIKFGVWLNWALEYGYDYLATGHYARLRREFPISNFQFPNNNQFSILKLQISKDKEKDQTYFLHQLSQKQLQHTLFPLGDYTKPEVRRLAKKFKLPTADKEESMGICFVGEVPMKEFLQKKIKNNPGDMVNSAGNVLGQHDGLAFYTIGQRAGAQVKSKKLKVKSYDRSLFVVGKNIKKNQLIVGYEDDPLLYTKKSVVTDINWVSGHKPNFPLKCKVRLRHRQALQDSIIIQATKQSNIQTLTIKFALAQRAVTPGQFAVFYKNNECLGGGVIQ